MPFVRCPNCKSETHVGESNYTGPVQCGTCNTQLQIAIYKSIVTEVTVNDAGVPEVQGLPPDLIAIYDETRRCMASKCFTAAELLCRKILMYVAVEKGAHEGKSFESYLSFLESQGYVTPHMRSWVDLIRRHGNQATHAIMAPDSGRAEGSVMFTAQLLKIIYEMDLLASKLTTP